MAKTVIYQGNDKAIMLDVSPTEDGRIQVAMIDSKGNCIEHGKLTLANWGKLVRAINTELDLLAGATSKQRQEVGLLTVAEIAKLNMDRVGAAASPPGPEPYCTCTAGGDQAGCYYHGGASNGPV